MGKILHNNGFAGWLVQITKGERLTKKKKWINIKHNYAGDTYTKCLFSKITA